MHAVKVAHVGQFRQVAPDGLQRDVEPLGQILDHHAPFGAGQFKDFRLPEAERHGMFLSHPSAAIIFVKAREGIKPENPLRLHSQIAPHCGAKMRDRGEALGKRSCDVASNPRTVSADIRFSTNSRINENS